MAYGQSKYGELIYSDTIKEENAVQIEESDLMSYLPPYLHKVVELQILEDALGSEINVLRALLKDTVNQCFINTATWGLKNWEQELALVTDPSKSHPYRREILSAKLRGNGTTTKEMIQSVAMAFSGGEVTVLEYPDEYRFEVQFVGIKGIPVNMGGLIQALDEIKPAHLSYSFKYSYTTWTMLTGLTWQQANSKTWHELKIYEEEA